MGGWLVTVFDQNDENVFYAPISQTTTQTVPITTSNNVQTSPVQTVTPSTSGGSTAASPTSIITASTTTAPFTCGSGPWTLVENRCFSFESTVRDWIAASSYCHSLNGVLVTVFDQRDENFLYVPSGSTPTQQPVSTTPTGSTASPATTVSTPVDCGNGTWTNVENRCFIFVPTKQDAIDASVDCHNMGGWLVTVFDHNDENVFYAPISQTTTQTTTPSVPITTTNNVQTSPLQTVKPSTVGGSTAASPTSIITASTTTAPFTCGSGPWTLVENRCFSFESTQRDWIAASSYCHSLNGFLVTIYDQKDEDFLHSQAGIIQYFIGLNDVARNGTWIWDQPTGQTLTFTANRFLFIVPTGSTPTQQPVSTTPASTGSTVSIPVDCAPISQTTAQTTQLSSGTPSVAITTSTIVQTSPLQTVTPSTAVASSTSIVTASPTPSPYSCGNGSWTLVENRCFSFESSAKDWIAASSYCHSLGGVLVTIFDKKDEDFLYGNADSVAFFIGLNDVARNGTWIWDQPTGQTLTLNDTKFTNWAQGQPNLNDTSYDHRCVVDQKDVGWVVTDCMTANFYACEKAGSIFDYLVFT
uniref:C-type lectin domain-containing protein n=1 Tax=Acrobeloides nanus TaxID=290746 RepID=A0A914E6J3_9BILA